MFSPTNPTSKVFWLHGFSVAELLDSGPTTSDEEPPNVSRANGWRGNVLALIYDGCVVVIGVICGITQAKTHPLLLDFFTSGNYITTAIGIGSSLSRTLDDIWNKQCKGASVLDKKAAVQLHAPATTAAAATVAAAAATAAAEAAKTAGAAAIAAAEVAIAAAAATVEVAAADKAEYTTNSAVPTYPSGPLNTAPPFFTRIWATLKASVKANLPSASAAAAVQRAPTILTTVANVTSLARPAAAVIAKADEEEDDGELSMRSSSQQVRELTLI